MVVVHTANEALLIKRKDHTHFWQSVTGSLEWGEAAYPAALRELAEETGIHADSLRHTGIVRSYEILSQWRGRYPPNTLRNREHLFFYRLDQKPKIVLDTNEHTEFEWLDFARAETKVFSWSNRLAISSLR